MKVLGLVGSPRKGGNTDILVDTILTSATEGGHGVDKLFVYPADIGPCIDCRGCKKDSQECVVTDGMQAVYPRLDAADVILFGTPVYWCGPTGPMKLLIDRLRPYYGNRRLAGKKAVLVAPAGDGPSEAEPLSEMIRRSCAYLDIDYLGEVLGTAYDRGDILGDRQAMQRARTVGAEL